MYIHSLGTRRDHPAYYPHRAAWCLSLTKAARGGRSLMITASVCGFYKSSLSGYLTVATVLCCHYWKVR